MALTRHRHLAHTGGCTHKRVYTTHRVVQRLGNPKPPYLPNYCCTSTALQVAQKQAAARQVVQKRCRSRRRIGININLNSRVPIDHKKSTNLCSVFICCNCLIKSTKPTGTCGGMTTNEQSASKLEKLGGAKIPPKVDPISRALIG